MRLALALSLLACGAAAASAQPAVPGYSDWAEFRAQVARLDTSDLAAVTTLDTTLGGREIFAIAVGTSPLDAKPAIAVFGSVHAPHLLGSELSLRLARLLVEKAAVDPEVKKLLERVTFYIVPRPNPDASEAFFRKPWIEREGNARWTNDDRDGATGEDGPEDLDGDGSITLLRVADESGRFVPHPADPRILIEVNAREDERGRWSLQPEGSDNDQDGAWNEDASGGVAFNRNFPFQYPYFQKGAGAHPVSEAESRAVADFLFDHPNIAAVFAFTPEDNLMNPWQPNPQAEGERIKSTLQSPDAPYHHFVARIYRETLGAADPPAAPDGSGSISEWAYFQFGRWSFAARGWWIPKVPPPGKKPEEKPAEGAQPPVNPAPGTPIKPEDARGQDQINALRWLAREKIDGFAEWKPVQHPDFPGRVVEVGGVRPFVLLNPPVGELDPLAEKHFAFLRRLASLLPDVRVHETRVEAMGGGVWRLTAVFANRGYLPSMPAMGKITGAPHPLWARLELPAGASLVTGNARRRIDPLEGNGGKTDISWVLRAPAGARLAVEIGSPATGRDRAEVEVK